MPRLNKENSKELAGPKLGGFIESRSRGFARTQIGYVCVCVQRGDHIICILIARIYAGHIANASRKIVKVHSGSRRLALVSLIKVAEAAP